MDIGTLKAKFPRLPEFSSYQSDLSQTVSKYIKRKGRKTHEFQEAQVVYRDLAHREGDFEKRVVCNLIFLGKCNTDGSYRLYFRQNRDLEQFTSNILLENIVSVEAVKKKSGARLDRSGMWEKLRYCFSIFK